MPPVLFTEVRKAEDVDEERLAETQVALVQPDRVKADDLPVRRHRALCPWREFALVARFDQRHAQPMWIGERDRAIAAAHLHVAGLCAFRGEALRPVFQRALRYCQRDLMGDAGAVAAARHAGPREEREI